MLGMHRVYHAGYAQGVLPGVPQGVPPGVPQGVLPGLSCWFKAGFGLFLLARVPDMYPIVAAHCCHF